MEDVYDQCILGCSDSGLDCRLDYGVFTYHADFIRLIIGWKRKAKRWRRSTRCLKARNIPRYRISRSSAAAKRIWIPTWLRNSPTPIFNWRDLGIPQPSHRLNTLSDFWAGARVSRGGIGCVLPQPCLAGRSDLSADNFYHH